MAERIKSTNTKSRKVASNTVALFMRMLILMVVNLYAVRLVINGLGEQDYGIFNTVAAVVMTASFLSGVLALSIQRFYSYAAGENDDDRLRQIYSTSVIIVSVGILVLLAVFETVGLWFVNTQLTIPDQRLSATVWAYQFSILAFIFSFYQIPFLAAVFSHENMSLYTVVSTFECFGRLAVAVLIGLQPFDRLAFYGGGLCAVALVVMLAYVIYSRRCYAECKMTKVEDKGLFRQLLSFSGWTTFGSLASTFMMQGGIILLNIFFGPLANAAFGIAMQINNGLNTLSNSLVLPFRPAMIKAYAAKNFSFLNQLFTANNKSMFYLFLSVCIPIILEMRTILTLWLGTCSDDIVTFSRLMVVYTLIITMHNPITIVMHATGRIKQYHLPTEMFTLLSFPITWILYLCGLPSYSIFFSIIGCCVAAHVIRLICIRRNYQYFSIRDYISSFFVRALVITAISFAICYEVNGVISSDVHRLICVVVTAPVLTLSLAYIIGITHSERIKLNTFAASIIRRNNTNGL